MNDCGCRIVLIIMLSQHIHAVMALCYLSPVTQYLAIQQAKHVKKRCKQLLVDASAVSSRLELGREELYIQL